MRQFSHYKRSTQHEFYGWADSQMSGHHHVPDGSRRLWLAVGVNGLLTIVQIVGGVLSGSLSLIADALHNFSDAVSLIIALVARKIARRPADDTMTFGYGRAEIVAALINYTTLIVIGLYLVYEAIMRFIEPQTIEGWLIVLIAGIALAVDLITAALTYAMSKNSVNIRAAFLHNVADALGSIAVIVAGSLILIYDWMIVDPIVTLMIAGYILWQSFREIGPVIRLLMLGVPRDKDPDKILEALVKTDGIESAHHLHVWEIEEGRLSAEAHIVVTAAEWSEADRIKQAAKAMLEERFDVGHSTLEFERGNNAC